MRINKILTVISLLLVAVLCFSSCGGSSTPKSSDASGTIEGTNLTWKFTASDNTLEIKGEGAIPDFTKASDTDDGDIPWKEVMQSIEKVEIEKGITRIGNKSFYGAANLSAFEFDESLTEIGDLAFAYTGLTELDLEADSIKVIGKAAFEGCTKLTTVNTGDVLESLGERAFAFCSSLTSVNIPTPVKHENETFYNCKKLENIFRNPTIDGYDPDANAFKGTEFDFANDSKEYSKEKVIVTVNYVFEDGSKETETKTVDCRIGETYSFALPTYEGYKADVEGSTLTGVAKSNLEENTVTVTYKKVEAETLPDTSDLVEEPAEPNYLSLIIMTVVVVGVIVGAFFLMKSSKKEAEKAKNQNKAKNRKQK